MKKLLPALVLVVLLATVVLIPGCRPTSSFRPVDGGAKKPSPEVIKYAGTVLAQEFVERDGETHTILFLTPEVDGNPETKKQSLTIEVINQIIFVRSGGGSDFWLFEFTPTEEPNIYTITKMEY